MALTSSTASAMVLTTGSILVGEHDGEDPDGDLRIGGVGGVDPAAPIEVIDFPDHPMAVDLEPGAVVLAPGIVVGIEVGEARHGREDFAHRFGPETSDPVCHHDHAASAGYPQLVVELPYPRQLGAGAS